MVLLKKILEDGNCLYNRGRLKEAEHRFEYALKRIANAAATSTTVTSPTTASSPVSNNSSRMDAMNSRFLMRLSFCLFDQRRFEECAERASRAIENQNDVSDSSMLADALLLRARARSECGEVAAAQADVRELLRIDPKNRRGHELCRELREIADRGEKITDADDEENAISVLEDSNPPFLLAEESVAG